MYICVCNGHRESEIREAAAQGLRSAPEIYQHLGKPPRCGRCLDTAAQVVAEVHESLGLAQAPAGEACS